jgi:hypothetical protein
MGSLAKMLAAAVAAGADGATVHLARWDRFGPMLSKKRFWSVPQKGLIQDQPRMRKKSACWIRSLRNSIPQYLFGDFFDSIGQQRTQPLTRSYLKIA